MTNLALIEARRTAHLSQSGLAREVRLAGWRRGDPNGCTREMVSRWDRGTVRRPQSRYLLLLEDVLGQPAGNLGFDADLSYDMDRAQALADAGLDSVFPLPSETGHGPLSGIWLSSYSFTSSGRGAGFTSRHYVMILQYGARLMVRSLQASESAIAMDLSVNGQVITGTWTEQTRGDGYYRGAVYVGSLQLIEKTAELFEGRWIGFGKEGEINDGPWSLKLVDKDISPASIERWDLPLA